MEEELTDWAEFENEVQVVLRSEGLDELTYERMLDTPEDLALEQDLSEFAMSLNFIDWDHFHSAETTSTPLPGHDHS